MILVDYDLVEMLFGTNKGRLLLVLLAIGILILISSKSRSTKDWLNEAQERQNKRYDYTDPAKPTQDNNNWVRNKKSKIWVASDQMDSEKHRQANEAVRRKWEEHYQEQAEIEALHTPIHLTQEEKALGNQIQIDRSKPTFEEWKAANEHTTKEQTQKEKGRKTK